MKKVLSFLLSLMMAFSVVEPIVLNATSTQIDLTNAQVYAYGYASGHDGSKIKDNDVATYWQTMPSSGEGSGNARLTSRMKDHYRYLDITLDGTYEIDRIEIYNNVDGSYNNYYVYASNDGNNYNKIISKTDSNVATAAGDAYDVSVSASKLRLNMAFHSGSFACNLAEIKIYGTKVNDEVAQETPINVSDWQGSKWQKEWDHFEKDRAYAKEKTTNELKNLVGRVIGEQWKDSFVFEIRNDLDGKDIFEIENGSNGKIVIRGNDGVSLASGFNYYIKQYLNVDYNPLFASNTSVSSIQPVDKKIIKATQYDLRYALNFCTYSYTMSFWNWDEYEKFIDWAAMNGVNLMLDIVGQEEVLRQTLSRYGYSDQEIKEYLAGPAYYAWFYMQNLYSYGGPLPSSWFEQRVELGRKMHDRMQTYGIDPVIQGFAGQVPTDFKTKNPDAVITEFKDWCNYTRPAIIQPYVSSGETDYFPQVARTFYEAQKNVFGDVSHYYASDPFHEGGNPSGLDFALTYQKVQEAMLESDPEAIWVMQQWQGNLNSTKLSGLVKPQQALALDLQSDMRQQNGVMENYDVPWIWCMLHNFGGRMGLDGNLPTIAQNVSKDYSNKQDMVGIGITPEALENSPIAYELLFDTTWSNDPIDVEEWVEKYAQRRAGGNSENLQNAWKVLAETAYGKKTEYYQGAAETVINAKPQTSFTAASTWGHSNIFYNKEDLENALSLLLADYDKYQNSEAYRYDLADTAEQVLCNTAYEYYKLMVQAFNDRDSVKFKTYSDKFLEIISLSDAILASNSEFMLGTWINDARSMISGADDWTMDLFEFNARALVTTWAGERCSSLNDYSNRKWSGVTEEFYKERWMAWIANRQAELDGTTKNSENVAMENNWFLYGWHFANLKSDDGFAFDTNSDYSNLKANVQLVLDKYTIDKINGEVVEDKENIALNKTITSTAPAESGSLAEIVDGDSGTAFIVNGTDSNEFVLDLGKAYDVTNMNLALSQAAGNYPLDYKIEYLDTNNNWVELVNKSGENLVSNNPFDINATTSKMKFTFKTRDELLPVHLAEITVYGTESAVVEKEYRNIALGKIATTGKQTASDSNISYVTDGNTSTLWKSVWNRDIQSMYPDHVTIDLGETTKVDYAIVNLEFADLPYKFHVEVTTADDQVVTVLDKTDTTTVLSQQDYRIDINQNIKKLSVVFDGTTETLPHNQASPALTEIQIFQEVVPSAPSDTNVDVDFTSGKLSVTSQQGSIVDGNYDNWVVVSQGGENVIDLQGNHYVDYVDVYFEKLGLGVKYQVIGIDKFGNRIMLLDKSSSDELLTERTVRVNVDKALESIVFVHLGNNGKGDAPRAELRLYEVEVHGKEGTNVLSTATIDNNDASGIIDGDLNTTYTLTQNQSVVVTLDKANPVNIVSIASENNAKVKIENYNEATGSWELLVNTTDANVNEVVKQFENTLSVSKIRVTAIEDVTIKEVKCYKYDITSNLKNQIAAIESYLGSLTYGDTNGAYDSTKKDNLLAKTNEAKQAIENGMTTQEVDTWSAKLQNELDRFNNYGQYIVDRDALLESIDQANKKLVVVTSEDQEALQNAYTQANTVYSTYTASQSEIDAAVIAITNATNSANEITPADKTQLVASIEQARGVDTSLYTQTSVNNLWQALSDATVVNDDAGATQAEVDSAKATLDTARENLVRKDLSNPANKELLAATITEAQGINRANKTTGTLRKFSEALDSAKAVNNAEDASQSEVDAATSALRAAIDGLLDGSELTSKLATANSCKASDYTAASYAPLSEAISAAQDLNNSEEATPQQLEAVIQQLTDAIDGLVPFVNINNLINTEANKASVSVLGVSSQCGVDGSPSEAGGGQAAKTLDYDNNTYWHTDWQSHNGEDHWISYDLGKSYDLQAIQFLPRQSASANGDIFAVKVYVSEDTTFEESEVAGEYTYDHTGHTLNTRDMHTAGFENPVTGRYVKFDVTHTGGDSGDDKYASMAEIRFYGSESGVTPTPTVDKTALIDKIADAEAAVTEGKTEESVTALNNAITAAEAVRDDDNATQEEVNEAVTLLEDAIAGLVDKPVDPTQVDKTALASLISQAETKQADDYTTESFAALTTALSAAQSVNGNANATQDEVDNAKNALQTAINGLQVKPIVTHNLINTEANKESVSVMAVSDECDPTWGEVGVGTGEKTLDYDNNTYWHSDYYYHNGEVHWIAYDLGKTYDVTKVSFLPRQNGTNGDIFEVKVYVSMDNTFEDSDLVNSFAFEHEGINLINRNEFKECVFDEAKTGRYVKMEVIHSGGDGEVQDEFCSMAEARFYGNESSVTPTPSVDKQALIDKIADAKAADKTNKTEVSINALNTAIAAAEEVRDDENATQEEVDAQIDALEEAIAGLVDKPQPPVVDKTALVAKIDAAKAADKTNKTEESINALNTAITAAEAVRDDENATQEEVNAQIDALEEAIAGLVDKPATVDKTALVAKITEAEGKKAEDYTAESFANLTSALSAALEINNKANATQSEVDNAKSALEEALAGLVDKPVDKSALAAKIADAKTADRTNKTEESVKVLEDAIKNAEAVNSKADATQDEVNAQVTALEEAIAGLVDKPTPVNKDALKQAITRASIYVSGNLSTGNKSPYDKALANAKAVLGNTKATQAEVNAATKALRDAIKSIDSNMKFPDVKENLWYIQVVDEAYARGLMGVEDDKTGSFSPDKNITRGMVATVLYRMAGKPKVTFSAKFPDVKDGLWYSSAIIWANQVGVVNGYDTGKFGPDDKITRQDLAIMLRNYAEKVGKLNVNAKADLTNFKDVKSISKYAVPSVEWAVANKLISGKENGSKVAPIDNATRAECAKMFTMLQDLIVK